MAGVLAGFAFLAIVLLLQARLAPGQDQETRHERLDRLLIVFVVAFLTLMIATFLYAVVGGEPLREGRALSEAFISGLVLSVGIEMLLLGIVMILGSWGMNWSGVGAAIITAFVVPLLLYPYVALAALDLRTQAESVDAFDTTMGLTAGAGAVLLVVGLIVAGGVERWLRRAPATDARMKRMVRLATQGAVVITLVSGVGAALISSMNPYFALPEWTLAISLFVTSLALSVFALLVKRIAWAFTRETGMSGVSGP